MIFVSFFAVPLLKKSSIEKVFINQRPVTNLSFISKLIKKGAFIFLCHSLINYDYLFYNFAYKTITQITKMTSNILCSIDKQ